MARVVSAIGIQGWIKLKTFTADPEALGAFDRWLVRTPQGWREMALEEFAVRPNGTAAKVEGCEDRDCAQRLRGAEVAVRRADLGEAEEGTLYWVDLIGLEVVDEGGEVLGNVEALFETGETSVLVVEGKRQRMIPFVPDYVKAVDREAKRITVDWKADYDA
jgi:16S rRNA processing protein RimM